MRSEEERELDGHSWSPPPGRDLEEDVMLTMDGGTLKDAVNYSDCPLLPGEDRRGKALVQQDRWKELLSVVEGELQPEGPGGNGLSPGGEASGGFTSRRQEVGLAGLTYGEIGNIIAELWTSLKFCSLKHCKAQPSGKGIFPLPTVHSDALVHLLGEFNPGPHVFLNLCRALNSLAGVSLQEVAYQGSSVQQGALRYLKLQADRLCGWSEKFDELSWQQFFRVKGVDYRGEEVMVAKYVGWKHLEPALPDEVGSVELSKVVKLGMLHYVENFDEYLIPPEDMQPSRSPQVMIPPSEWEEVARGLISKGICGVIGEDEVFRVKGVPVLNGMFGVSKNEWCNNTEVHRLIMNLIPINRLVRGVEGDVATLPGWSTLTPFFLDEGEQLVVSSEDIRCFFYIFKLPSHWKRYMAFNRPLPPSLCPREGKPQRYYLCSLVLPMGFKNSVSIAQHIHRNIIRWAGERNSVLGESARELRKDRSFSFANPLVRIYLDNFDLLQKMDSRMASVVAGEPSAESLALRSEYESWGIPRHPKKSVCQKRVAEVQGAIVDGKAGIAFPKKEKVLKYCQLAYLVVCQGRATLKEMQIVGGGLVYLAMFRRPLLGSLNHIWRFVVELGTYPPVTRLPLPDSVKLELIRFISLVPLSAMDFRTQLDAMVTASDASTTGGGITATRGLTPFGELAAVSQVRGDVAGLESHCQILSIGLFDGIGALRVALDALGVSSLGHISVETSVEASRVVEAYFPGTVFCSNVLDVDEEVVKKWACQFSQASVIVMGAGPPCQGVSGLNSERKGALRDCRSKLFKEVPRIGGMVRRHFSWAAVYLLMESVQSMDEADRKAMSEEIGLQPWGIDAVGVSLARRPRLYWVDWELCSGEGVLVHPPNGEGYECFGTVDLKAELDPNIFLEQGWKKSSSEPFPTFTTSRPRTHAGPRPAGLKNCDAEEVAMWQNDAYRFPPYQYRRVFRVENAQGETRLVNIRERETIMGFPVNYTSRCLPKSKGSSQECTDCRLSLLGNSWNVTVVTWLLSQLLGRLGIGKVLTPQECVDATLPGQGATLQGLLLHPPLNGQKVKPTPKGQGYLQLARKLTGLVSIKGEDILLSSPTDVQVKHHRLRASVPSRLWKWRTICGWQWKGVPEHINCLELRAVLTTIRWRLEKLQKTRVKFIHLVDSQVVLHALSRGRSSSRKLRRTLLRINSLLLATGSTGVWTYVHTSDNPADGPSRRAVKKRWVK